MRCLEGPAVGLLAHNKVFLAGARLVEGLSGQVILAGTTALPAPAFSTSTDGTTILTQSDPGFVGGSVGANSMIFSPLRLGFKTQTSRQLYIQGGQLFEIVLREQVSRGISSMLDNLTLFGTGTNGQPLGVLSTVTPVNLASTPMTWANYQTYRNSILKTDLDPDTFAALFRRIC